MGTRRRYTVRTRIGSNADQPTDGRPLTSSLRQTLRGLFLQDDPESKEDTVRLPPRVRHERGGIVVSDSDVLHFLYHRP